jgi:hypothetical protein
MKKNELISLISFIKAQVIGLEYKAEREAQELLDLHYRLEEAEIELADLMKEEDVIERHTEMGC